MGLIKIIANGIELDIVKETLTITKENNALSVDFKVSYSNVPFLIVENTNTNDALGRRDITSKNKPKVVPVIVEELGLKFYGELQILSYLRGFRKVTLKYATELLTIMDTPISEFMPVISVIPGETNPVPFTDKTDVVVPGHENWLDYPLPFLDAIFPAVKFQFPSMYWKNQFGIDLASDDPWINYMQHVNYYDDDGHFVPNSYEIEDNIITTVQENVPAPQVFLLSPLFYALESLGWKMMGDFPNSEFVKRILMLSKNNNLCETTLIPNEDSIILETSPSWFDYNVHSIFGDYNRPRFTYTYFFPTTGKYRLVWSFTITDLTNDPWYQMKTRVWATGTTNQYILFQNSMNGTNRVYTGTCEFDGVAGEGIFIRYEDIHQRMPVAYSLKILNIDYKQQFFEFHPTIELGRYVPDWEFGTYLNELKSTFNLRVDIDDVKKTLFLNFNEESIINGQNEVIRKSMNIEAHDQAKFNAFKLKFGNEKDTAVWITSIGAAVYQNQLSDFLETIENRFKFVPSNGYTSELSEDLMDKDGTGLMIYDPSGKPYTSSTYLGQTLNIDGPQGIYDVYWQKWLRIRLNASHTEMTGNFTETEVKKIAKLLRVYVDNQAFLVASMEYSETPQGNFEVLLKLESINF